MLFVNFENIFEYSAETLKSWIAQDLEQRLFFYRTMEVDRPKKHFDISMSIDSIFYHFYKGVILPFKLRISFFFFDDDRVFSLYSFFYFSSFCSPESYF